MLQHGSWLFLPGSEACQPQGDEVCAADGEGIGEKVPEIFLVCHAHQDPWDNFGSQGDGENCGKGVSEGHQEEKDACEKAHDCKVEEEASSGK